MARLSEDLYDKFAAFVALWNERLEEGQERHGDVDKREGLDALAAVDRQIKSYVKTGDMRQLVDAASYLLFEFAYPRHGRAHIPDAMPDIGYMAPGLRERVQLLFDILRGESTKAVIARELTPEEMDAPLVVVDPPELENAEEVEATLDRIKEMLADEPPGDITVLPASVEMVEDETEAELEPEPDEPEVDAEPEPEPEAVEESEPAPAAPPPPQIHAQSQHRHQQGSRRDRKRRR